MPRRVVRLSSVWFHSAWLSWTGAIILFAIEPSMPQIYSVVIAALIFSALLSWSRPLVSLYLLPLPLMVGPIVAFPLEGFGIVTAGDLYAAPLILRTIFMRGAYFNGASLLGWGPISVSICALLLLLCAGLSPNIAAATIGLVKIVEYALLVRASRVLARQPSEVHRVFSSWVFITTLCTLVMLWHFHNGRPPMINMLEDYSGRVAPIQADYYRFDVLFRPVFFYANFFIPMGISVFYAFFSVLLREDIDLRSRALMGLTIPVNFIALLMNNTRAMIVPVVAVIGMLGLRVLWVFLTRAKAGLFKIVILVLTSGIIMWLVGGVVFLESQRLAMADRMTSNESVIMRISLWTSTVSQSLESPLRFVIGWGPQSTVRQGGESYMRSLLTGTKGNLEGAFDSTIVGFLVEYGLIFTGIVFAYIAFWIYRAWTLFRLTGDVKILSLILMASILVVAHVFQQFGLSPAGLMALQIFGFLAVAGNSPQCKSK
jgi:hypothetical protein